MPILLRSNDMKNSLIRVSLLSVMLASNLLRGQDANPDEAPKETGPKNIFIPTNARAAAYVLGRLSNKELLQAQKVEPVLNAIVERKGLEAKNREDALTGLAALHKTDRLTELLATLERLDKEGEKSEGAINDLAPLLAKTSKPELAAKKANLQALFEKAEQSATRRGLYAALITADGNANPTWETASKDDGHLADLVASVPLVTDANLRSSFQSLIEPLAKKSGTPEVQRAAIDALPFMKGFEANNFSTLAGLIQSGTEQTNSIRAMLKLPNASWKKDQAGAVAQSLIQYASGVPEDQRTEQDFLNAVQLGNDLSMLMPSDEGKKIRKALNALGVRVIVLKTLHELMFFDKTRMVVEAGKPVEIIYENPDAMPHNFVVTAPGAREEVGKLADAMPPNPDEQGRMFVPKSPKVLFGSKLVEPGTQLKINFTAPAAPGEYTYVCTFPGHWLRMFGTLVVTSDIEEYLAKNPEQEAPKITEWKITDFTEDLKRVDQHRSFENGKGLFSSLGCIQCHQLGSEGAAFGPNLTGVSGRYKNDSMALLEQIVDPSKIVDPKFEVHNLEMGDENTLTGIVISEDADTVKIQTGPSVALVQTVKKSAIKSRSKSTLSMMPSGLLNLLNKEQILDLLAYLRADGDAAKAPSHDGH
ncbi:MAG: hypothetical protein JWM04_229 [Verrucomicrobiales bacterium]|nr:hypothetical protein [Verrucomicrobiales bacterium]